MKKIITLFKRYVDHLVINEVAAGAEWAIAGEGVATRKWDGAACLVRGSKLFKRHDVKTGKNPPDNWESCEPTPDEDGHWPGWLPVGDGPEDKYYREAFHGSESDGTYELCGPKINGNPEGSTVHTLIPHGKALLPDAPRTFNELRTYLDGTIEGIVWHHPDGRMVKIKARDFGTKRKNILS